jgi:hypothetical protein
MTTRRIVLAVLAASSIGACGGQNKPGAAGNTAATTGVRAADSVRIDPGYVWNEPALPARSAAEQRQRVTQALTKPLSEYTRDQYTAAEFWYIANSRNWKGHTRTRKCHDENKCGQQPKAKMWVGAAEATASDSFTVARPLTIRFVGKLENQGDEEDVVYHDLIPPKAEAYVILESVTGKVAVKLAVYTKVNGIPHLEIHSTEKQFRKCDDYHDNGDEGDFKPCPNLHPRLAADDPIRVRDATDSYAWFSCAEGCCGASFPPFVVKNDSTSPPAPKR